MFDIHCHILPGLDDGAFSEDESLSMAAIAAASGTRYICCTPHTGRYSAGQLVTVYRKFRDELKKNGIPIRIFPGQEIYMTENYKKQVRDISGGYPLTLNRSRYPLIEFHPRITAPIAIGAVRELYSIGLIPVIAHPERYLFVSDDPDNAARLKQCGALLQINTGSLSGAFGIRAGRTADFLLSNRLADFAASDAHSPFSRTPRLRDAHAHISEQYSQEYADFLMKEAPRRLLKNEKIYPYL